MPLPTDGKVVVSPCQGNWAVEWPEGRAVLARKIEAVKLGREISKDMPGRTMLLVLKIDGTAESTTWHGADRPPVTSYLQAVRSARPRRRPAEVRVSARPIDPGPLPSLPPGMRVLVVEDEFLTADTLKRSLESVGARVLGPVASVDNALQLIDMESDIDMAVLDVQLSGERVFPVATRLQQRSTPFVFTTGYGLDIVAAAFADAPVFEKPCSFDRLFDLIRQTVTVPGLRPA